MLRGCKAVTVHQYTCEYLKNIKDKLKQKTNLKKKQAMEQKLKDCWKAEQLCIYTALNVTAFR